MAFSCGHRVAEPNKKRESVENDRCPACDVPLVDPSPPRWHGRCPCCGTRWHLTDDGRVLMYESG